MSNEARNRRILAEARELLAAPPEPYLPPRQPIVEDALTRWRREHAVAEAAEAAEDEARKARPIERRLDALEQRASTGITERSMMEAIDRAIDADREHQGELLTHVIAAMRDQFGDELDQAMDGLRAELARARAEVADLKVAVAELRLADSKSKTTTTIIDMPATLHRRDLN